ncbi:NADH dehydrogenase [ubiquinone] 1 alpha subcomplex subunit 9, mitochondrial-like [Phragmites australis]|uniref:NADH dehydrogenase [ubiquinone] 1 alpha subcomplex subunit 9, mitochondrial-like n=1 Tax=Phragmites australis TaxID=29695 RepID=UPI002D785E2D|nr:NADH dehydrogenase [ubiquinone] 1 alpha subcomplex subunit 9, mitochondrial-like [Phragmites australis]
MQAAAWRRHLLDHHLSPTTSAAIAAIRSASQPGLTPQGLCGADGARYMSSARAPAVEGSGHLVRKGTGGRSSVSGIVATVFGATGFLGRYLVQQLAKMGTQVLVPFRGSEDCHRHLKVMGDLGQIVSMKYHPRDVDSIKAVMAKSNVVVNLIGREYETRNYGFEEVNHHMAEQLAMIAKEHGGIMRFIQVSCLGASPSSESRMLRAKAAGEESVLKEFPEATIMRPATIIGTEDRILNRWAQFAKNWGFLPLVGGGSTKIQPVYVTDVAAAIVNSLKDDGTSMGKTYELGGPEIYTVHELAELMYETIREWPRYVNVPLPIAAAIASPREMLLNKVPFPLPTPSIFNLDQINAFSADSIVSEDALTFEDLEIMPQKLKGYPVEYLTCYRKGGPSFGSTVSEKMGSFEV